MRETATALIVVGALSISAAAYGAASTEVRDTQTSSRAKPAVPLGTYAVRGTVKAVDAASLVIARSARQPSEMTFILRPSTETEGEITIGSIVSVRYVTEHNALVATAVFAHPERQHQGIQK